jgi:hypothetical protein
MTEVASEIPSAPPSPVVARLAERKRLLDLVFEHNPDGVCIATPTGEIRVNPAGASIMRSVGEDQGTDKWAEQYGLFHEDKTTQFATSDLPLVRALVTREHVVGVPVFMRNAANPSGAWLSIDAHPLPDG